MYKQKLERTCTRIDDHFYNSKLINKTAKI